MDKPVTFALAVFLLAATVARGDGLVRADDLTPPGPLTSCFQRTVPLADAPAVDAGILQRLVKYTQMAVKHRVNGLASYYSSFFDGRKTANGEVFGDRRPVAAGQPFRQLRLAVEVGNRAPRRGY